MLWEAWKSPFYIIQCIIDRIKHTRVTISSCSWIIPPFETNVSVESSPEDETLPMTVLYIWKTSTTPELVDVTRTVRMDRD